VNESVRESSKRAVRIVNCFVVASGGVRSVVLCVGRVQLFVPRLLR
jgi:hypothetical protein